jgi:hypothetical protein
MKKLAVISIVCIAVASGCSYLNKYAPYKLALKGLSKAYETAIEAAERADEPKEVAGRLNTLATAHEKSNPAFEEMWRQFPELMDPKSDKFPEALKEDQESLKENMQKFVETFKKTPRLNNMRDKEAVEAAKRWSESLLDLKKRQDKVKAEQKK